MASIKVIGQSEEYGQHTCILSKPDVDGDYTFICAHADVMIEWRPLDEVIAAAENHADGGWGW